MIAAILFDFFGTLVEYSPSRVEQGYHATHELLLKEGVDISYAAFLENWVVVSEALDRWSRSTEPRVFHGAGRAPVHRTRLPTPPISRVLDPIVDVIS